MRALPSTSCLAAFLALSLGTATVRADIPIAQHATWSGAIDFFATGASIAVDGSDPDTTMVESILHPATVDVDVGDIPGDAVLVQAFLYWAGTVGNSNCLGNTIDRTVDFTPPGLSAPLALTADVCHCSDAGVTSYDTEVCRVDVTALIADMLGSYTVDGFQASIQNRSTDTASFSLVFVYSHVDLPPRRIALYDGVQTMYTAAGSTPVTTAITLSGLKVDNPPQGDLASYVLEGDKGGSGTEGVTVSGQPGGATIDLGDDVNPVDNPMNHTINTTNPVQTETLGVDIDRYAIDDALTWHDTSLLMTYSAGTDKYWIAYNVVGVNVFEAVFGATSTKTWILSDDTDDNGVPTAGDTLTYTIHLANTGRATGTPIIDDLLTAGAIASWSLVSTGGGTDETTGLHLRVVGPAVAVGASFDIVYDVVLADQPDETPIDNTALFDSAPDGDSGKLVALPAVLRHDSDGDGIFDNDDNCVDIANADQTDDDHDARGNACDDCDADPANDVDDDTVCGDIDNCPSTANTNQSDRDDDGLGDPCDACADDATNDADDDGTCENVDNCAGLMNPDQADRDGDDLGDACDACGDDAANDSDKDGRCGDVDNCPTSANADQADDDSDGLGNACDVCLDVDDDDACDPSDNCVGLANAAQGDRDGDLIGDACDLCPDDPTNERDGGGVCGAPEQAPETALEASPETSPETAPEPATDTTPEASSEPAAEPTIEPAGEAVDEPTPEAASEGAAETAPVDLAAGGAGCGSCAGGPAPADAFGGGAIALAFLALTRRTRRRAR